MKNICYVNGKQRWAVRCANPHGAFVLRGDVNRRFGPRAEYDEPGRPGYIAISESEFRAKLSLVAQIDTSRFGAIYLDWHMRDSVKRSKRYASWAEACEAYKHRSADVVSATTLYQTVTVKVGGSEYTYFSDYGYQHGTAVVVELPSVGESIVEVVSSAVMSKKDLEKRCSFDRFKHIVRKATKRDLEIPNDAETSRDMAEAFALPKSPHTYGYSTFSDDDTPW